MRMLPTRLRMFLNQNSKKEDTTKNRKVYVTAIWKPISFSIEYHGQQYQKMEEQWAALLSLADSNTDFFTPENRKVIGSTHVRNNTPYATTTVNGVEKKLGVTKGDTTETPTGWTKLLKSSGRLSGQYKKDGVYYYCNIASPFIVEEGAIKYIDYDLDLRVFPDGSFKVLDRGEYKYHKSIMRYSEQIDCILKSELTNLINAVREKGLAFEPGTVEHYYEKYKEILENKL